jgi:hypothetical protein
MYQEPQTPEDVFTRIDTEMEFEVTYWSRKFGVTKALLRQVVAQVGDRAAEVKHALAQRGQRLAA